MEKIKKIIAGGISAISIISNSTASEINNNFNYSQQEKFIKKIEEIYGDSYDFSNWKIIGKNVYINKNYYINTDILKKVLNNNRKISYLQKKYKIFKNIRKTSIIIAKSNKLGGKFIYLLYKKGELKIASYVSPGSYKYKTPRWNFHTNGKYIKKRSKKYNGYPMPFAIHLDGPYFIHWGKIVNGNPESHGCFRLPGIASWINFRLIKTNEKIPIKFLGYNFSI